MRAADSGPFDLPAGPRIPDQAEPVARPPRLSVGPSCSDRPCRINDSGVVAINADAGRIATAIPGSDCGAGSIQPAGSPPGEWLHLRIDPIQVPTERPDHG